MPRYSLHHSRLAVLLAVFAVLLILPAEIAVAKGGGHSGGHHRSLDRSHSGGGVHSTSKGHKGGCDCPSNMQSQTAAEAKAKDRVERRQP
jgi:hypothetical protein